MPTTDEVDRVAQTCVPASPRVRVDPENRPKILPPYVVVLHDDPVNGFAYVIRTLRKVFHYNMAHAFLLTLRAHRTGRSAVWTGQKEHAEFRADQLRSCGPDPAMAHRGAGKLSVSIEPMPGA
jgi:ATP-dependent Clp protease adaptor protein ClpS